MTLKNGALVMATHMKHPDTGEIIPIADLFNGGVL
jgi:hypothetical protein